MSRDDAAAGEPLIFVPFIHAFGGVERLVLGLSRYLHDSGLGHAVVCFDDTIDLRSYADWPLQVSQLSSARNSAAEFRAILNFAPFQAGNIPVLSFDLKGAFYSQFIARPSVIHLTDPPSLLPTDISRFAFSTAIASGRWFTVLRAPFRAVRGELVHRMTRRGVRRAAATIAMTERIASELFELYGVRPAIVRPGVTLARPLARPRPGVINILSVSRLEATKRVDWIIRAMAVVASEPGNSRKSFDWHLDIVGEGSARRDLENLVSMLGLQSRITFHGRLSDTEVDELMSGSSLFVMPAAQGYGLPALEALAAGVPVVLHRDSGVSEILGGSHWAKIIESSDGSDLAAAVIGMMETISRTPLSDYPVPHIPSEHDWAAQISRVCTWT